LVDKNKIAKENEILQELKLAKEEKRIYQEKVKKTGNMFYIKILSTYFIYAKQTSVI